MLYPTRGSRRGLRAWWVEHVAAPLDRMYAELDEHQQSDDDQ